MDLVASLQAKKVDAMAIKRYIDLFYEAIAGINPGLYGHPDIVEAGDVAKVAKNFQEEYNQYAPEI